MSKAGFVRLGADVAVTLRLSEWKAQKFLAALGIPIVKGNWRGTICLCLTYRDAVRAVRCRSP